MGIYPLSEGKLVAGTSGKHRIVRSINVMDAPDISDWIKEGEMVFTTAYLIKDRPSDASQLLRKLNGKGSSGLGIKLGRYWNSIPETLVEEADELGFPLIELPYRFTFSDQMNALFQAEIDRSTETLRSVMEKQKRLMRFALRSDPIGQLFDAVSDMIDCKIAVLNARGQTVFNNSEVPDWELRAEATRERARGNGWQAYRVPVAGRDGACGCAYFFVGDPVRLTAEEGLYVQAAELISFHMNADYQDYYERSLQNDFGSLVMRCLREGLSTEELVEYAGKIGVGLFGGAYRCVLTDVPGVDGAARQSLLRQIKGEYLGRPALAELQGVHVVMEEGLLSVFPVEQGGADRLPELLSGCMKGLGSFAEGGPKASVSSRKRRPDQLREAFAEARDTLRTATRWGVQEQVVSYRTMELTYLFEHVPQERMETYTNAILGDLLSKDPDYAQEMLRTLEAYIDCDGQMNETAKRLFVHRNTATYRIEKLSELLEIDLKKMNDLLRLKLVFLFRRMNGGSGERKGGG